MLSSGCGVAAVFTNAQLSAEDQRVSVSPCARTRRAGVYWEDRSRREWRGLGEGKRGGYNHDTV